MSKEWYSPRDDVAVRIKHDGLGGKISIYVRRPDADRDGKDPAFAYCSIYGGKSVSQKFKPKLPLDKLSGKLGFPKAHATSGSAAPKSKVNVLLALAEYDGYGKPWKITFSRNPAQKLQ